MKKNLMWALALALGGVVGAVGCELAAEQGAPCTEDADCDVATGEACTDPDADGSTNCNCGCDLNVGACDDLDPTPGTQSTTPCPCDDECGGGTGGGAGGCTTDAQCGNGMVCTAAGTCIPDGGTGCTTDAECGNGMVCTAAGTCIPDGGTGCTTDADCGGGMLCAADGSCIPDGGGCANDGDCGLNEICQAGMCMPAGGGCTSDLDCFPGESCLGGNCIPDQTGCASNLDCAAGENCVGGNCIPGGGNTCVDACQNVYVNCGAGFSDQNGNPMTQDDCVTACDQGGFGGAEACIATMACTQEALDACFGGAPGCTTDADCGGGQTCVNGACTGGGAGGPCATDPNGQACTDCANAGSQICFDVGGACETSYGEWITCLDTAGCIVGNSIDDACLQANCTPETTGLNDCAVASCPDLLACY